MRRKKLYIFLLVLGIVFLILGVFGHYILNSTVKKYVRSELEDINSKNEYLYQIGDLDIHLIGGSIVLKDFQIKPSNSLTEAFNNGESKEPTLKELSIEKLSLKGIDIKDLLANKHLHIKEIRLHRPVFKILKHPENFNTDSLSQENKSTLYLDSIQVRRAQEITLSEFEITDYELQILDIVSKDTILRYSGKDMVIDGIGLEPSKSNPKYFNFNTNDLVFKLQNQEIDLNHSYYYIDVENLVYKHSSSSIEVDGLAFKPLVEDATIWSSQKYSSEIYKMEISKMKVDGFDLDPLIHSGLLLIDNITIDSLNADIARDKSKPYNTSIVKPLPQHAFQNIQVPLLIHSLTIQNSHLNYSEQENAPKDLLDVHLANLNIDITNITSLKDTSLANKALNISIKTDLSGNFPVEANVNMPYFRSDGYFTFTGHSTKSINFDNFNSVIFKAISAKIDGGILNGMSWKAEGNSQKIHGDFTLLYKDLQVEVYKEDKSKVMKTLSWIANAVVPKSNPGNNGKVFVAAMEFERVKYKGIGNYLWKSIQSGLTNSLNPVGKQSKNASSSKTENSKKSKKKKKRQKKKNT